jgi:hypothetical protein
LIYLKDIFKGLKENTPTPKYPIYTKETSKIQETPCAVEGGIEMINQGIPSGGGIWDYMEFVKYVCVEHAQG